MSNAKVIKIEDFEEVLKERGNRIKKRFSETLISNISNPEFLSILKSIGDSNRDFFRPTLTALACEAVGGQPDAAEDAALIFTLASAGFGIHDDIVDKSENKHFKNTLLGKHGLETALLVGDLLIVKAWTTIQTLIQKDIEPKKIQAVVEEYGKLNVEICEAEYLGFLFNKKLQTELKTHEKMLWEAMAEIEACTRIGAIMGNGSKQEIEALAEFGRRLGFTHRLISEVTDTLNIEGNLPQRIKYESIPLPILFAAKSSQPRKQKIESIIQKPTINAKDIKQLLTICFETKALEYILNLAKKNRKKANSCLKILRPSHPTESLFLLNRQSFERIAELIP